jgi:DNA-binding LacI/PurR family transcriptional regulator
VHASSETDLETVRRASVDGVAGMCTEHPASRIVAQRGLPLVFTDPDDASGSWVAIDDRKAGVRLGK